MARGNTRTFDDIMNDLAESVRMSSRGRRWLRSTTFWDLFDYKQRTQTRIDRIQKGFEQRRIVLTVSDPGRSFGDERKTDRIILTLEVLPTPDLQCLDESNLPPDDWFSKMESKVFDSEKEVEFFFVSPLLEQLGYDENDFVLGHPVRMSLGGRRVTAQADCVVVEGENRENKLVVIEAKNFGKRLDYDTINQAKSYAMWLPTPYYVVTNGVDIRVYQNQGPQAPEVPRLAFERSQLRHNWPELHGLLNRSAVVEYKRQQAVGEALGT